MDEIDADIDLSTEGKACKKRRYAAEAIAEFENSKVLLDAKDAVERQLAKWAKEMVLRSRHQAILQRRFSSRRSALISQR